MSNLYFTSPTDVVAATLARSTNINDLDAAVDAAFDKLPTEVHLKHGTTDYAVDTGVADAYLVSLPYTPSGYVDGLHVRMRALNTNTGASTINVNSLGVKSIRLIDSSVLTAGDITAGGAVDLTYSTATGYFHVSANTNIAATSVAVSVSAAAAASNSAAAAAASAAAAAASAASILHQSSRVWISDTTASNSATVDVEWTNNSAYDDYELELIQIVNQTLNKRLTVLFKVNGAYNTSNNYTSSGHGQDANDSTYSSNLVQTADGFPNTVGYLTRAILAATETYPYARLNGVLRIPSPAGTSNYKGVYGVLHNDIPQSHLTNVGCCLYTENISSSVAAMTGIRFAMNSGNIVSGTFRLWGITKTN